MSDPSPQDLRKAIRSGEFTGNTSGYCAGYVQANLAILPKDWASEFLQFCQQNPKPCPLVGMSAKPGDAMLPLLGEDVDIRSDVPKYRVFEHGECVLEPEQINEYWRDDFVAFLLGCSFSFEEALIADGLEIRNVTEGVNVPMYRTNLPCQATERLRGHQVVSMRPMKAKDAIRAIQICSRFPSVHGAPIHFGDPAEIGIADINSPDFGDPVTIKTGEVPVFWACGVTPQVIIEQAKPPICITHAPGHMLVTDIPNSRLASF